MFCLASGTSKSEKCFCFKHFGLLLKTVVYPPGQVYSFQVYNTLSVCPMIGNIKMDKTSLNSDELLLISHFFVAKYNVSLTTTYNLRYTKFLYKYMHINVYCAYTCTCIYQTKLFS